MSDALSAAHFRDDAAARKLIEGTRWPNGPVCAYCGSVGRAYALKKPGWFRCAEKECRKDFTVTMGTVMERSHIPLHKWITAFYLMNASKKGISAHQLHRQLGIAYQSAWFMCHRIREAMRAGGLAPPLGGVGKTVEADETYFGTIDKDELMPPDPGKPRGKKGGMKRGIRRSAYRAVLALVERGGNVPARSM
jgi:transposase-like protein